MIANMNDENDDDDEQGYSARETTRSKQRGEFACWRTDYARAHNHLEMQQVTDGKRLAVGRRRCANAPVAGSAPSSISDRCETSVPSEMTGRAHRLVDK